MNIFRTTLLLTALTVLLVLGGNAMAGPTGMKIALVIALVMNFGSYWFSDKIVLKMYRAQEVSPEQASDLYGMVSNLTRRAGLPMPKVYIINNPTPNAFATGRNPNHAAVAVTTGILQTLDRNELMGVLAHELAHVKHRDILIGTVAATVAGAITMLASMAKWAMIFGGHRDNDRGAGGTIAAIAVMILAPIAAMIIQMAISRSREYAADKGGAQISGNPKYLASALQKLAQGVQRIPMDAASPATAHMFIVNPLRGGGMRSLFSTHPPIEERVRRLEAMRV